MVVKITHLNTLDNSPDSGLRWKWECLVKKKEENEEERANNSPTDLYYFEGRTVEEAINLELEDITQLMSKHDSPNEL